jgi:DNA polymerase-4
VIACVFIPYFAAAVERQVDASLATRPLILSQSDQTSGQVLALSAEAAQCGVRPGMSLQQAQALCPPARFIPANPAHYHRRLNDIVALLAAVTPKVEAEAGHLAAIIYADLSPLNHAERFEFAGDINQTLHQHLRLSPAFGLASGKFPAYVAAGSIGLNRVLCITPGQEGGFLAPLAVTCLPLEAELTRRFGLLGLRTVGQFAALPAGAVLTQFGPSGRWLHQLAQGHDDRPVRLHLAPPEEHETRQLDEPVTDRAMLLRLGQSMLQPLATRLARQGQGTLTLGLTLHLSDDSRWQDRLALRQPTANREQLARHLTTLIERVQITCSVVALTLSATDLVPLEPKQLELFAPAHQADHLAHLQALLPRLVRRYGPHCFYEPVLTNPHAYLPERRFQFRAVEPE